MHGEYDRGEQITGFGGEYMSTKQFALLINQKFNESLGFTLGNSPLNIFEVHALDTIGSFLFTQLFLGFADMRKGGSGESNPGNNATIKLLCLLSEGISRRKLA